MVAIETIEAPPTDNPIAARALEWAADWYPGGTFSLTGLTEYGAIVLVEVDEEFHVLRYENLDAGSRCEVCGAPLL